MASYYDAHVSLGNDPTWAQLGLPVPFEADALVQMMDRAEIHGALVTPARNDLLGGLKSSHERIARAAKKYPSRLLGVCRVRPRSDRNAQEEIRRMVEGGFKVVELNTSDDGFTLRDRSLIDPVVETCGRLNVPVMFDADDENWPSCTPSLVAEVAVSFPQVTFIMGRMGFGGVNGWPGEPRELIPAMQKAPNLVAETGGVFLSKFIQDVVDAAGPERVLMGSNGPYAPIELPIIMFAKHLNKLTAHEKELVMGGNLKRVLKIGG